MLTSSNCDAVIPVIDCDTVNDTIVFAFNDGDDVGLADGCEDGWLGIVTVVGLVDGVVEGA